MKAIALAAMVGIAGAFGGMQTAAADGASLAITPGTGACTDTISVHAEGLQPGVEILLMASAPGVPQEVVTFDWPTTSSWDFTLPPGVRYLCDDIAAPTMELTLWTDGLGQPTTILASATFTRTKPDTVAAGPTVEVIPDQGPCETPMVLTGSGFPPNDPVDVILGPLYTTLGSGGAGIGIPGGTTRPDGSYRSDVLVMTRGDGSASARNAAPIGSTECAHFDRLKIIVAPAKTDVSAQDFPLAVTVFHRADVAAPAAGSGVAHRDSPRWIVVLAWVAVAAAVCLALVASRRR